MAIDTPAEHETLVRTLLKIPPSASFGGNRIRIDTHISTVILAGDAAFKIKKPVNLGFLDFSTLAKREFACREELRLNRRLAPSIYVGVSPVTGTPAAPVVGGQGPAIDWAVRMRRFDPAAVLSERLELIDAALLQQLANDVACFHRDIAISPQNAQYGDPAVVLASMLQNFGFVENMDPERVARIRAWTRETFATLRPLIDERKSAGHIRECHGDLHLGNIALIDGRAVVFDAIEFNPSLRWIDTIDDAAFLCMDLRERGLVEQATCWLDHYLEQGGDYAGLGLLRFYEVYRAMVRAKIAAIRLTQRDLDGAGRRDAEETCAGYLTFAEQRSRPLRGGIVLMHGVSGSGKSRVSEEIRRSLPALRLRSDVERKRGLGIDPTRTAPTSAYDREWTARTYQALLEHTRAMVSAGEVAVVDATFLRTAQREPFLALAETSGVPLVIVVCDAPAPVLRQRIATRAGEETNVSDADLSVLEAQLREREPLSQSERDVSIVVSPHKPLDIGFLRRVLNDLATSC